MKKEVFIDKMQETIQICDLHHERMFFAYDKISSWFPLTIDVYDQLTEEQVSFSDQLIYRFSQLQDTMGLKFFNLLMAGLGENTDNMPFIDVLCRMEQLDLIDDHNEWLMLRETRNIVTYEYPFNKNDVIDGLNELFSQSMVLSNIWISLRNYAQARFF